MSMSNKTRGTASQRRSQARSQRCTSAAVAVVPQRARGPRGTQITAWAAREILAYRVCGLACRRVRGRERRYSSIVPSSGIRVMPRAEPCAVTHACVCSRKRLSNVYFGLGGLICTGDLTSGRSFQLHGAERLTNLSCAERLRCHGIHQPDLLDSNGPRESRNDDRRLPCGPSRWTSRMVQLPSPRFEQLRRARHRKRCGDVGSRERHAPDDRRYALAGPGGD